METPKTILTDEQKGWIEAIEADAPHLPLGYAKAMVELYISNPELFTEENLDKWRNTPVPARERTDGHAELLTGDAAEDMFDKMKTHVGTCEIVPLEA